MSTTQPTPQREQKGSSKGSKKHPKENSVSFVGKRSLLQQEEKRMSLGVYSDGTVDVVMVTKTKNH